MVLAKLVQAAAVEASDHVLDVGCASGYSSALLGRLARSVLALEEEEALVRLARENLKAIGADNVTVVAAPLTQGWQATAPYDVIFLNGATEIVPQCPMRPAQGRRPTRRSPEPRAHGPGNTLPLDWRRRRQRMADLRCRRARASGICRAPRLRVLGFLRNFSTTRCGAKTPSAVFISKLSFALGAQRVPGPIMANIGH